MINWLDFFLSDFEKNSNTFIIVQDHDYLLSEEKLSQSLQSKGYEILEYNDPVEFRYVYELKYRNLWDNNQLEKKPYPIILINNEEIDFDAIPIDILRKGRKLKYSLAELFPRLSYSVIRKMNRSLLDVLYKAQQKQPTERLGENATMNYILHHAFGIDIDRVLSDRELLRELLRIHYRNLELPQMLIDRIISVLERNDSFKEWPLRELISNRTTFFSFIQERWLPFLDSLENSDAVRTDLSSYKLKHRGPGLLPFDNEDIRVYIDSLFMEGQLKPIHKHSEVYKHKSWVRCGVVTRKTDFDEIRITRQFETIKKDVPNSNSNYKEWTYFAKKMAELTALVYNSSNNQFSTELQKFGNMINDEFAEWLTKHFSTLINLPPTKPVMSHHITRCIMREMEKTNTKAVLIILDGLSCDQWITVRQVIREQLDSHVMNEQALFSWIPTLTSISRQAIFSGKPPIFFPSSVSTTNSEENLWKHYWEDAGFARNEIGYLRGLSDGIADRVLEEKLSMNRIRILGLVVDKVDKIMHGMQLGSKGMHNQIRQWTQQGFLRSILDYLLDRDFDIWLTSDHGNIECQGKGRPSEGVIAEKRGERVRIYPTPELRERVAKKFKFAVEWKPVGLPEDYFPLVSKCRNAFLRENDTSVSHGGISIEEVIVPLVKITRK